MPINSEKDILDKINLFKWYSAVDFGNGIVAKTNYPLGYCVGPDSIQTGADKWDYIIKRNLPDLQGKKVLDLGCNNGIMCVMAARAGAVEIVGIDSNSLWKDWIEQAKFVKEALEWRCRTIYPITFIDANIIDLPKLNLGYFDVVLALCCLYYLSDTEIMEVLKYLQRNSGHIVVQCNTARVHSKEVNRRATPKYMGNALKKAGFKFIYFDIPFFYQNPIVVGSNKMFKERKEFSFNSIISWLRSKL